MQDNGRTELLTFGGECMPGWLHEIINCVWISEKIPDDWRRGIILPFWKRKGDRLTCANHRGITILPMPGKRLALILLRRSVSAIRSRRRNSKLASYPGAQPLVRYFPSDKLSKKGSTALCRLLELLYSDSESCVRVGNDLSEWFYIASGVR